MTTPARDDEIALQLAKEAAQPVHLAGFTRAADVWPELRGDRPLLLHAGPPLDGQPPSPAMLGALVACLLLDGRADDPDAARDLLESGAVRLVNCHSVGAVGAMAGAVGANTPVVIVERADGRRAVAPVNEGVGAAVRFGNFDPATLTKLRHLADIVGPALDRAVRASGPIDILDLQAAALRRGDEGHNRNVAATAMLVTRLAPAIVATNPPAIAQGALQELADNAHFFLALSMAAAKATADALHAVAPRGIVTAIASNGHGVGIRVSGLPGWCVHPGVVEIAEGIGGHDAADFAPPMGDSPVTEVVGLGAAAITAAPSLARTLGWSMREARAHLDALRGICRADHALYQIPDLDFAPTSFAISVERVVETGIAPCFTTGFSHRDFGGGRAGFGLVRVARAAFTEAADQLAVLGEVTT